MNEEEEVLKRLEELAQKEEKMISQQTGIMKTRLDGSLRKLGQALERLKQVENDMRSR